MSVIRALLFLLLCAPAASAGDWPQWLGPKRDNSSPEVIAPWKEAPKVLWRLPAGEGNSSPVVAGGRLFFHAKVKDKDEEEVTACDANTGKIIWQSTYGRAAFKSLFGNGPRATPAVSGDAVYTFGITGVLSCFEATSGRQLWQVDTWKGFNPPKLFFGMSCSPLVEGKGALVNVGGKGSSIVAFDKDNGQVLWKSLDDRASYSSPTIFGEGKERQAVFLTGEGLVSLNPSDGTLNWKFPLVDKLLESSATPVLAGTILVGSAITYGSVGLQLESADGKPSVKEIWKNEALNSYFSTPVAVGDTIYIVTGTKPPALFNSATLHCVEAKTGKILWSKPKVGTYHACLLRTGDNKLLMLEEAGNLVLIDPDPKEYRELARAKVCGEAWAHPALANGRLYVRDEKKIICLQMGSSR
jgi:outer membrane protein assembly factor BamB